MRSRHRLPAGHSRCGMTLVELLTSVAIIAALLGLLVPAVQAAREGARRASCGSNVRQVSIAFLAHEQAKRRFPPGSTTTRAYWGSPRQSWFPRVLPFVEAATNVDGLNLNREPYDGSLARIGAGPGAPIAVFLCPSDDGARSIKMPYGTLSLGSYPVFFSGGSLLDSHPDSLRAERRAAFGFNFGARIADFTDGTSRTMILTEYLRSTGEMAAGDGADQRGMLWQADEPGGGHVLTGVTPNSPTPDVFYPIWWCVHRPALNQPCLAGSTSGDDHTAAARSRHPGGVSIARADGSVTFVADEISLRVWQDMSTIAGVTAAAP